MISQADTPSVQKFLSKKKKSPLSKLIYDSLISCKVRHNYQFDGKILTENKKEKDS